MERKLHQIVIRSEKENRLSGGSLCYIKASRRMSKVRPGLKPHFNTGKEGRMLS